MLISDEATLRQLTVQRNSSINLFRLTDNASIHSVSIQESNILSIIFYRGIKIYYFDADQKSFLGDFDVLDGYIRSLVLAYQNNSYNLKNSEIGLLSLSNCRISSLNIFNGCKVEAYITNSEIDKIEFKHIAIPKDTLISLNSCKVFSIVMENFSVIGNLYFRNIEALKQPLDEEWSNINKYFAKPNILQDSQANHLSSLREDYLNKIKRRGDKKWIYETESNRETIDTELIKKDYIKSLFKN